MQLQVAAKQSPNQEEWRSVIPNITMTRHECLAVSRWEEESSHLLTSFPCLCPYELGAASEIPAVEHCSEGTCTSLGTTMQGMDTKIYWGAAPSHDFTGYTPAQAGHKRECIGESYKFIYKSNGLFSSCFPIDNPNKKGIFTCYLDTEKLYCSCSEMCFPPKLLLCSITAAHLS